MTAPGPVKRDAGTRVAVRPGPLTLDAPHALHAMDRVWPEKNCYVDLWIELLHARGLEPEACLSGTLAVDFVGDQWTFFKPPLAELRGLYGIDVQELTVWQPLVVHALEHLGAGRWISVEADAWWLPDTTGTDYRRAHTKTTIVLDDLDTGARRLGYFHNAGYHVLDGDDYDGLFAAPADGTLSLPPYAESIDIARLVQRSADDLRRRSAAFLAEHLAWRPEQPVERFRDRFEADLAALRTQGLDHFHRWAFAGVRQLGAACELGAAYVRWMKAGEAETVAARALDRLAQDARTLQLKAARAVHSGRPIDAGALFDSMAAAWRQATEALREDTSEVRVSADRSRAASGSG